MRYCCHGSQPNRGAKRSLGFWQRTARTVQQRVGLCVPCAWQPPLAEAKAAARLAPASPRLQQEACLKQSGKLARPRPSQGGWRPTPCPRPPLETPYP